MGSPVEATWTGFDGSMYMGTGSSMEIVWLGLSIVLVVVSIWHAAVHEAAAYKKMELE